MIQGRSFLVCVTISASELGGSARGCDFNVRGDGDRCGGKEKKRVREGKSLALGNKSRLLLLLYHH